MTRIMSASAATSSVIAVDGVPGFMATPTRMPCSWMFLATWTAFSKINKIDVNVTEREIFF
jgi:hypothetical protein